MDDACQYALYADVDYSADGSVCSRICSLGCLPPVSVDLCLSSLGACVSALGACVASGPGTPLAEASLSFTLDSGASQCFFRDHMTLTPLLAPFLVALEDPSSGPAVARNSTTLPCPVVPSGVLRGLQIPSFTRPPSGCWIPPGQGGHRYLCGEWEDCGLYRCCYRCCSGHVHKGAPLRSLRSPHRALPDCFLRSGPAPTLGPERERYFLVVVDDYSMYTMVFPLAKKSEVNSTLIWWLLAIEGTRGSRVRCLHSDRGAAGLAARGFTDPSLDRLSAGAIPCVSLGFSVGSPDYSFYHSPLHQFLDSRDVRFDESVSYYTRYPCRGLPVPPPPFFLAPSPPPAPAPPVPPPPAGPAPSGTATGGTRSGGAHSRGVGAGGAGTGGASYGGAGSGGASAGDTSSGGTGAGGTGAGGASSGGAGARGAGAALRRLEREEQERLEQERRELQQLDQQQQQQPLQAPLLQQLFPPVSGLWALSLPSSPPVPSQSPTAYGPTFPPPKSTPDVFSPPPPQSQSSPPVVPHDWTSRCPPRAQPLSPLANLRTVLFRSNPRRSPPVYVLPSPPESSLTVSSHPITDYYRAPRLIVSCVLATLVTDPHASPSSVSALTAAVADFASTRRLDYTKCVVAAPSPHPLSIGSESALGCDVLEDWQFELEFLAAASPSLCAMLLSLEGDPNALNIPTPSTYREAVSGEWASQRKAAMDSELASRRSTGTYINTVPPPRANVVDGMWLFKHCETTSYTAFLQGCLQEEIWLRRPPVFTDTFPPRTQWSLRRPVYSLRQSPREWHDTLRSMLRDLGFRPSSADPSLFVRAGSTPFFILVYVYDLVFATADRAALAGVNSELQKRHMCTDLGEVKHYLGLQITRDRAARTITLTQSHMVQQVLRRFGFQFSTTQPTPLAVDHRLTGPFPDEPFESSGPYAELVGCLAARHAWTLWPQRPTLPTSSPRPWRLVATTGFVCN
ncbi:unnamed protein product [Closterium sp. NIES-53]